MFARFASVMALSALLAAPAFADKHNKGAAKAPAKETLAVDAAATKLEWTGTKPTGDKHMGTVGVKSGSLNVEGGNLVSGQVDIDMTTLAVTDLTGDKAAGLRGHLLNDDFFAVYETNKDKKAAPKLRPENATAKLVITKVEKTTSPGATHNVSGQLTIRNTPKDITFPATIDVKSGLVVASAKIPVNRTHYGVNFGSGVINTVKDRLIDDVFTVDVKITAKK